MHVADTHPDAQALLATILADPASDAARLVYADFLEEHGETERAEFIRVQLGIARICSGNRSGRPEPDADSLFDLIGREAALVDLVRKAGWFDDVPEQIWGDTVVNRGFVAEVRCRLSDWVGGECRWCVNGQLIPGPMNHAAPTVTCRFCPGTGRTPAHGVAIVAAHPVERVEITDREPYQQIGKLYWFNWDRAARSGNHPASDLPVAIFSMLAGVPQSNQREYVTDAEARADLSRALLLWARRQPVAAT